MGHAAQDMTPADSLSADEWNDEWGRQMGSIEKEPAMGVAIDSGPEPPERGRGIAEKALQIINDERQDEYGAPEDNFRAIARLWTAYISNKWLNINEAEFHLTDANVADMMVLFKMARMQTGMDKLDSSADLVGYALLGADLRGAK